MKNIECFLQSRDTVEYTVLHDKKKIAQADLLMEKAVVIGFQWFIVQQDLSFLRLIQALQQTHTGTLSFSGWTHKSRHLTWPQLQKIGRAHV